jgi:hypothetical protein
MIQSLRAQSINADFHSVKKTDFDTLMTAIYDTRLRGYWNELLVEEELLKLRLFGNNKIDHPSSGSKDLADAVAGAVFVCVENMAIDGDVEIEILSPDKYWEENEDIPNFGTVQVYNRETGEYSSGFNQQETDGMKWLENL